METVEMVIRDHIVFDELITNEYLAPVMVSLITKKPEMIISCIVELPKPPVTSIFIALKKANPKNVRFFSQVLTKIDRLYSILDQEAYDAGISRCAFCRYIYIFIESFECEQLQDRLIRVIPFMLKTIK